MDRSLAFDASENLVRGIAQIGRRNTVFGFDPFWRDFALLVGPVHGECGNETIFCFSHQTLKLLLETSPR